MKKLMLILERYVESDGPRLRIGGAVTRDVAHYQGVPHGAVQVGIVTLKNGMPHFLLHKRSQWKKTSPNTWDICGGHIDVLPDVLTNTDLWVDQDYIAKLFSDTGLREAREELEIISKPDFEFQAEHLHCFGGLGVFDCGFDDPSSQNREYSSFYLACVPKEIVNLTNRQKIEKVFRVKDTVAQAGKEKEEIALELRVQPIEDIVQDFRENPKDYADGVGRVLARLAREPGTLDALNQQLIRYYK